MKITGKDQETFFKWTTQYFRDNRQGVSKEIFNQYKKDFPPEAKRMEKLCKKTGAPAYIGRYLLPRLIREGWLILDKETWTVKVIPERCARCFSPIEDIYVIDIENRRYCSTECMDEAEDAPPHYDSFVDSYFFLFDDYKDITLAYRSLLKDTRNNIIHDHILTKKLQEQTTEVLDNHDSILFNGGDDGPLAAEMYRMLLDLQQYQQGLEELEAKIMKKRPPQTQFYSITINQDYMEGPGKQNPILRKFIKKHMQYRDQTIPNTWTTPKVELRNRWWETLHNSLGYALTYQNTLGCSLCGKRQERKYLTPAADEYLYCEECLDYL